MSDDWAVLAADAFIYGFALVFNLQDVGRVSGQGLGSVAPAPFSGYPDNGDSAIFCQNCSRSFSATQLVFRCGGYTSGISGSPLLAHLHASTGLGTVIRVIGGYQQGGVTDAITNAAALGPHIAALYRAAAVDSKPSADRVMDRLFNPRAS